MKRTAQLTLLAGLACIALTQSFGKTLTADRIVNRDVGIPNDLKYLHIDNPYANYAVVIDQAGKIIDLLCTESTHYGLLEKGEQFIRKTKWKHPKDIKAQDRYAFSVNLRFIDYEQENWKLSNGSFIPQGSSGLDGMTAKLYRASPEAYQYTESKPIDLDHPLQIVEGGIVIVQDDQGQPAKGVAVVKYYIGPSGETHFPEIIESSDIYVSNSAIKTLDNLKFAPPTKNSNPTFVLVKQPFTFN